MFNMNLQLFSGGGARSGLGGGGRSRGDAANSNAATYTFFYLDENGNRQSIRVRGDTLDEAKEMFMIELRQKGIKKIKALGYKKTDSKQQKIASNVSRVSDSVSDNKAGAKIDLSDSPLSYTKENTGLSKSQIKTVKQIAEKIKGKTKEDLTAFDKNGKIIYNKEGTGLEVSTPAHIARQESYDIHNHTRGEGVLGGTFSVVDSDGGGDMVGFTKYSNKQAAFVSTKEGVYYISKGENFKPTEFMSHMRSFETNAKSRMKESTAALRAQYGKGNMNYSTYKARYNKIKNRYLVEMHNEYLRNQGRYGYNYGLIKSK